MADAIVVLNAGSSSLKFSAFVERGDEFDLIARGQAEGLSTAPRFVAKDGAGKVLNEKSWGAGVKLGHDGALDHLVAFLRAPSREGRTARGLPGCRLGPAVLLRARLVRVSP